MIRLLLLICWCIFAMSCGTSELQFGVIADCQYCDCDTSGSRYYRNSPEKLKTAVQFFNTEELDFVVHLGDLIDRDIKSYEVVLEELNSLKATFYPVLGNHEYAVEEGFKDSIVGKLDMPSPYYSFSVKGWRFIVVDGNDVSFYTAKDSTGFKVAKTMFDRVVSSGAPNAQKWNGGVGKRQMEWLEKTLDEAKISGERVLLFCHFPLLPMEAHSLWNAEEVNSLLKNYPNISGWFNGHNHAGGYSKEENRHYVTFHGMVETEDTNAYSLVSISDTVMTIDGFGREPDRQLMISR